MTFLVVPFFRLDARYLEWWEKEKLNTPSSSVIISKVSLFCCTRDKGCSYGKNRHPMCLHIAEFRKVNQHLHTTTYNFDNSGMANDLRSCFSPRETPSSSETKSKKFAPLKIFAEAATLTTLSRSAPERSSSAKT